MVKSVRRVQGKKEDNSVFTVWGQGLNQCNSVILHIKLCSMMPKLKNFKNITFNSQNSIVAKIEVNCTIRSFNE